MGLFGVVTSVTFKIGKRYLLEGNESKEKFTKSSLYDGTKPCLKESIEEHEYYRSLWYPQNKSVQSWNGKKAEFFQDVKEYVNELGVTPLVAQLALQLLDCVIKYRRGNDSHLIPDWIYNMLIKSVFDFFVNPNVAEPIAPYCDLWYKTIPTDEGLPVDDRMKMVFTEIWLPMSKANDAMKKLKEVFDEDVTLAHNTPVEFYGAKKSEFWMSPSNQMDMVRIDAFWYDKNQNENGERDAFYKVIA